MILTNVEHVHIQMTGSGPIITVVAAAPEPLTYDQTRMLIRYLEDCQRARSPKPGWVTFGKDEEDST